MSCFEYGMERTMVERCTLSGSDLKIKFRTILLTSIIINIKIIVKKIIIKIAVATNSRSMFPTFLFVFPLC